MKNKLINIINQCTYNKSIEDFKALTEFINIVNDDNIKDINISFNNTNIYVSMFNSDYKLISISFTDSNILLFCLPDNISKTYVMDIDCHNMQYNDIKALLKSDNSSRKKATHNAVEKLSPIEDIYSSIKLGGGM